MDRVGRALSKRLDFSGRETRRSFWLFLIVWYVAIIALLMLVGWLQGMVTGVVSWALFLAWLGSAVFPIAAGVRRLHDGDHSGWWLLIGIAPLVGAITLLILLLHSGTEGPNRFGPDPRRAILQPQPESSETRPA